MMKLLHLADLHFGRNLEEFSLLSDQRHIIGQILDIVTKEQIDAVMLAGDVYDRSVPSVEATELLEFFLVSLAEKNIPVYLISGNHDSAQRLSFAHQLMELSQIYISPTYQGKVNPLTLKKQGEEVDIFLLPFLKPVHVKKYFPEAKIESYTDAMATAIAQMEINPQRRSILVTHQFVTGSQSCESEEISVGGSDNVDASVFEAFDYVALGHLHSPQTVGRETIRYAGSPLKYSFSEVHHEKSVTIISTKEDGKGFSVSTLPLTPLRDLVDIKGTYKEVSSLTFYEHLHKEDFYRCTLTDEEEIPDAMSRLRSIYPNILKLRYDNTRSRTNSQVQDLQQNPELSPFQLFSLFFKEQNGAEFSSEQENYVKSVIETIWEDRV